MTRGRPRRAALALLLVVIEAAASPGVPRFPGLIGLLEMEVPAARRSSASGPAPVLELRAGPSDRSGVTHRIGVDGVTLEMHEWSYESPAVAVYGLRHDGESTWYELGVLPTGDRGWVRAPAQSVFHPVSALLDDSLAFMTNSWDGRIYGVAGDDTTVVRFDVTDVETPVMVAGSARRDGKVWALVVMLAQSPCASAAAPGVAGAGWVPVHGADGRLNLWFYSRGC